MRESIEQNGELRSLWHLDRWSLGNLCMGCVYGVVILDAGRMIRRLLVDGDAILYRVAAALQQEVWWDDHTRTVTMDVDRARREADAEIAKLKERAKADVVFVFIGPSDKSENFRRKLWPAYKAHRRSSDVPVGLGALRDLMQEKSSFTVVEAATGLEADDTIAEYATDCTECRTNIVWSPDKDLWSVPGWHLDNPPEGLHWGQVSDSPVWLQKGVNADYWHMIQTLIGDVSDGYPGCVGVGPVKAARLLEGIDDARIMWAIVVGAYEKQGLTEQDALVQARVARILRAGERPGEWLPSGGLIRNV